MIRRFFALIVLLCMLLPGVGQSTDTSGGESPREEMLATAYRVAKSAPTGADRAQALGIVAAGYARAGMENRAREVLREALGVEKGVKNLPVVRVAIAEDVAEAGMLREAREIVEAIENHWAAGRGLCLIMEPHIRAGALDEALQLLGKAQARARKEKNRAFLQQRLTTLAEVCTEAPDPKATGPLLRALAEEGARVENETRRDNILASLARSAYVAGVADVAGEACDLLPPEQGFESLLAFGEESARAGKVERAGDYFSRAETLASGSAAAEQAQRLARVAQAYGQANIAQEGRKTLAKAIRAAEAESGGPSDEMRAALVEAHLSLGQLDDALEAWQGLAGGETAEGALMALTRGLAGAGRYQEAVKLAGSVKSDSSSSRALAGIAEQCVRRGDYDRASEFLGQITDMGQLDAAFATLAGAAAAEGETDRAERFVASIKDRSIRDSANGALVADHLARGPADTLPERAAWAEKVALGIDDDSTRAIGLLAVGNAHLDAGRIEDARRVAERMLELPEEAFDATWESLGDALPEFARSTERSHARHAVGVTRAAVLFARVGEDGAAQEQVERAGREIANVACSGCRKNFYLHLGNEMLAIGRLRWAERAAVKAGKQAQTHDLLLSIAGKHFDKGADEEGHRVLGKVLVLGSRTKVRKDKARTVCAVGEFFAGTELALTPAERGVLSKLVPTAPEVVRPRITVPAERAVKLVFFHKEGCPVCARVKIMLKDFLEAHPEAEIQYRELTTSENFALHDTLCRALNVPKEDDGTVPAIFSTERFIVGSDVTPATIAELAESAVGLPAPWLQAEKEPVEPVDGEESAHQRKLKTFTIPAVIVGGLIDGVNPCAFAVIIFFITYMKFTGKTKRQMFRAGLLYTVAVFVTYLAIGLGLYGLLGLTEKVAIGQIVVTAVMAVFVLVACVLSVVDGFRCLAGRTDKVMLKLPDSFKGRIHHLIAARTREGLTVAGVLTLGFLVALFEFPCTGQFYTPIVLTVREWTGASLVAFAWLVVYNLCFILPLVVVFIALLAGMTSERLIAVYQRHLATVKFAMAAVFAGLFVLLVWITPALRGFLYGLLV